MKPQELFNGLTKILPTAHLFFGNEQKGNYCIYSYTEQADGSDDDVFFNKYDYTIELYTKKKDLILERKIKTFLESKQITDYEVLDSTYIETENRLMTVFFFSCLNLKED